MENTEFVKNEIEWKTAPGGQFPMTLDEKGLGLKGSSKYIFYTCTTVSLLSMIWVIVISVAAFVASKQDSSLPSYYPTMSIGAICIAMMCMNILIKFIKTRTKYEKHISIEGGVVKFQEKEADKTPVEWTEKVRKFEEVSLRHYNFRGMKAWYVVMTHREKTKKVILFSPDYVHRNAPEDYKRSVLKHFGDLFGLPTSYKTLEECVAENNENK